jgi:cytochrome d ubiquinol oxidase subunit II
MLALVSVATLFAHPLIAARWGWTGSGFNLARLARLSPIPVLGAVGLAIVAAGLATKSQLWPFVGAVAVFVSGYLGLAVSFFPYMAPYGLTFRQAANDESALSLLTGGLAIILPFILGYTAWVYWLFRGKVADGEGYH